MQKSITEWITHSQVRWIKKIKVKSSDWKQEPNKIMIKGGHVITVIKIA